MTSIRVPATQKPNYRIKLTPDGQVHIMRGYRHLQFDPADFVRVANATIDLIESQQP